MLTMAFSVLTASAQAPIKKPVISSSSSTTTTTTFSSASTTTSTSKPSTGGVSVQYTPNGATVCVDGTRKGTTPCEISGLSVGSHTVEISLDGYDTVTRTIEIKANIIREISGTLTKTVTASSSSSSGTSSSSSSKVSVSSATGTIGSHGYVDLGLSVKWATCNVEYSFSPLGSNRSYSAEDSSPEDYGSYFAWGETTKKSSYDEDNCPTYGVEMGDISGNSAYDAARANWGSTWRMPTKAECQELIDNCTWTWTTYNGKEGYKVVSKKNNNSIFLPAAGYRVDSSLNFVGKYGYYCSSTPNGSSDTYYLYFNSNANFMSRSYRYCGRSVRPVSE